MKNNYCSVLQNFYKRLVNNAVYTKTVSNPGTKNLFNMGHNRGIIIYANVLQQM